MTLNTQWGTDARNVKAAALNTELANGFCDVYTGSQPANGDSTITGTKLVRLSLGATPFQAPAGGAMTNNQWQGVAIATGTPGYFVMLKADGTTHSFMGSCGTSASNLNIGDIANGATVTVASGAFTDTEDASVTGQ